MLTEETTPAETGASASQYGEGQVVDPIEQTGDHSVSEPVPRGISCLRAEGDLKFMLKTTSCDSNDIVVEDMQVILSEDRLCEINGTPFIGDYQRYRLCLYVRNHKGYFAIGLRIMKSDNDKNLVWPFKNLVVFRLINQSGKKEDEIKMFHSGKNGSRLKDGLSKPKKDMNLPIGYPRFISKERLLCDGFIRDNIMLMSCYIFPKDTKITWPSEYPSMIR